MARNSELSPPNIYNTDSSTSVSLSLLDTSPLFTSQPVSKKLNPLSAILTMDYTMHYVWINISGYVMCLQILNGFHRHIVPLNFNKILLLG